MSDTRPLEERAVEFRDQLNRLDAARRDGTLVRALVMPGQKVLHRVASYDFDTHAPLRTGCGRDLEKGYTVPDPLPSIRCGKCWPGAQRRS